jgi:hypothetical protein
MKTRAEVETLKRNWSEDPCWDIEDTEGFEDHREELAEYRRAADERREAEHLARMMLKADEIGCPGNLALAAYVLRLERTIDEMDDRMDRMEGLR